jgi:hypothetical protein
MDHGVKLENRRTYTDKMEMRKMRRVRHNMPWEEGRELDGKEERQKWLTFPLSGLTGI